MLHEIENFNVTRPDGFPLGGFVNMLRLEPNSPALVRVPDSGPQDR
jgi:hypothetical protein